VTEPFPNREEIRRRQLAALRLLVAALLDSNPFYGPRLRRAGLHEAPGSLSRFTENCPFTEKRECVADQQAHPPYGTNLTHPLDRYTRFHQTSGSTGRPMRWLDTNESWEWMLGNWSEVYRAAGVTSKDRVYFAFSFGPFLGFWTAFESALRIGCLCLPGGGLSSLARLGQLIDHQATVLCCTPTYALHLAEAAAREGIDLSLAAVRTLIVAGEPGGSVPAVRQRIATAWGADVLDHAGATEIGPWGVGTLGGPGLEVIEDWFHPEFLTIADGKPAAEGELAELVITTLGRAGCPVIRYRTGDVVRPRWPATETLSAGVPPWVRLEGGVLGRADDMLVVRGVNVFPSAIDNIVRSFPEIAEYRLSIRRQGSLDSLSLEIEDQLNAPERVARELHVRLGLRADVEAVALGSLPRFEGKGRRVVDERSN